MNRRIDYSVYLVTDSDIMSTKTMEEAVEKAIMGGVTLVQLREKKSDSVDFYNEAVRVKMICDKYHVPLIINDRFDIALAIDADGVHMGQSDIPAIIARKLMGKDKIIGVSVTTLSEAMKAKQDGADYLGVGAMFSTDTKLNAKIVQKQELKEISEKVDLPVVIIGGINEETIPQFWDVDIDGVAVVSAILAKKNITEAANRVKELFKQNRRAIVRKIKGAIFDLDGTLLDSMDVWKNIDIEFLHKRGFEIPDDYIEKTCAKSFREVAKYTIELFKLEDKVEELLLEWNHMAEEHYCKKVKLLPFVKDYLLQLKHRGIKLGVATSLPKKLYEPCLRANGVYDLFEVFCSVDEVKSGKEFPDIFNYTIDKMGLLPYECILFEDTLPAIKSAKKTGAVVYGVYDKYSKQFIEEIKAISDGYIDNFENAPILR